MADATYDLLYIITSLGQLIMNISIAIFVGYFIIRKGE